MIVRRRRRGSAEVNSFSPLPSLNTDNPDKQGNKDHCPFPANACVQKDDVVETWNVQRREHQGKNDGDRKEQEAVSPQVVSPSLKSARHVEERATEVNQLPREEQEDPRHCCVACRAGAESLVTDIGVAVVAVCSQVSITKAKHDNGERTKNAARH